MSLITDKNRCFLAFLTGFCIPISTILTNVFCLFILLSVLIDGDYKKSLKELLTQPIALVALLLFVIVLIGSLYTPASTEQVVRIVRKYREFIYIPLFFMFFSGSKCRDKGLYGFLSAMGLTLLVSYFTSISGYAITSKSLDGSAVFKNHIDQNLLMALAVYFVLIQCWVSSQWRWLRVIIIILAIYNIFFISSGRTGQLVFFALTALFFFQQYRYRGVLIASILLSFSFLLLYYSSQLFQARIDVVAEDLQRYKQGDIDKSNSIGSRLEFYENSIVLFKENPAFGGGTGSFTSQYESLSKEKGIQPTKNPHNEYLMIGVQWGGTGLLLFFCFIYLLLKYSHYLEEPKMLMAQGLVLTIVVGCLFNSLWLDSTSSHIFAYLISLLYSKSNILDDSV